MQLAKGVTRPCRSNSCVSSAHALGPLIHGQSVFVKKGRYQKPVILHINTGLNNVDEDGLFNKKKKKETLMTWLNF